MRAHIAMRAMIVAIAIIAILPAVAVPRRARTPARLSRVRQAESATAICSIDRMIDDRVEVDVKDVRTNEAARRTRATHDRCRQPSTDDKIFVAHESLSPSHTAPLLFDMTSCKRWLELDREFFDIDASCLKFKFECVSVCLKGRHR